VKIIDCSIRDGGHLNKWNFSSPLVKSSYEAAKQAGASAFEMGYRYPSSMGGLGIFGYCEDSQIRDIIGESLEGRCALAVMMDTGKTETNQFKDRKDSPFSIVRVAAYPHELEKALIQVEEIKAKGYTVFLNPMVTSALSKKHYKILEEWKSKNIIEAIYLADSFGSFVGTDVINLLENYNNIGYNNTGFHAHNNLQMAVSNTLTAIEGGASWVDATIFGIGRGAGNAPIEIVMGLLNRRGHAFNISAYLQLISSSYKELYSSLDWSLSSYTTLGGLNNVHPYYMDEMKTRKIPMEKIIEIMPFIQEQCSVFYDKMALSEVL
jgi:4-hydroxy 2-oxovalerate aldolase